MSKLQRVILEYDDKIMECSGEEADRYERYLVDLAHFAAIHGVTPFKDNPINWGVVIGGTPEAGRKILEEDIPVGKV